MRYYFNIGSNLGNKRLNLYRAIEELSIFGTDCDVSDIIESKPWGFESENGFLNIGMAISSTVEPQEMLDTIHLIEQRLGSGSHRDKDGNYTDRLIDIDIMAIDDEKGESVIIDTPTLTVPHPHLYDREFFIVPYRQLKTNNL